MTESNRYQLIKNSCTIVNKRSNSKRNFNTFFFIFYLSLINISIFLPVHLSSPSFLLFSTYKLMKVTFKPIQGPTTNVHKLLRCTFSPVGKTQIFSIRTTAQLSWSNLKKRKGKKEKNCMYNQCIIAVMYKLPAELKHLRFSAYDMCFILKCSSIDAQLPNDENKALCQTIQALLRSGPAPNVDTIQKCGHREFKFITAGSIQERLQHPRILQLLHHYTDALMCKLPILRLLLSASYFTVFTVHPQITMVRPLEKILHACLTVQQRQGCERF